MNKTVGGKGSINHIQVTKNALSQISSHVQEHRRETVEETLETMARMRTEPQILAVRDYETLIEREYVFATEFKDEFVRQLGKQVKGSISKNDPLMQEMKEVFPNLIDTIIAAQDYAGKMPIVRRALADARSLLENYNHLVYRIEKARGGMKSPDKDDKPRPVFKRVVSREDRRHEAEFEGRSSPKGEPRKKPIDPLAVSMDALFIQVPRVEYQQMLRQIHTQEAEIDDLSSRLSRFASNQLTQGNPNIADLSDKNRPTKLGEKFGALYDDQWSDAFEVLKDRYEIEKDCIYQLLRVVRYAYAFCQNVAADQLKRIMKGMKEPVVMMKMPLESSKQNMKVSEEGTESKTLTAVAEKHAKLYRKECALDCIPALTKLFKKGEIAMKFEWGGGRYDDAIHAYIDKCVEILWLMCVQDPPMELHWPKEGDRMDTNMFAYYGKKGKKVDFTVWPALILHKDGPTVSKGYVQPV